MRRSQQLISLAQHASQASVAKLANVVVLLFGMLRETLQIPLIYV